jgi:hypothetical protein
VIASSDSPRDILPSIIRRPSERRLPESLVKVASYSPGRDEANDKHVDGQPYNCDRQPWMRSRKGVVDNHLESQRVEADSPPKMIGVP